MLVCVRLWLKSKLMKIFVTGTRGIPDIPGGIEKHCRNLYPLIVSKGHEVYVAMRRPYVKIHQKKWNGVNLVDLYAPASKNLEAIVHTFLTVLKARQCNADILHIHANWSGTDGSPGEASGVKGRGNPSRPGLQSGQME